MELLRSGSRLAPGMRIFSSRSSLPFRPQETRQQEASGGGRGALAEGHLALDRSQAVGDRRGGAELLDEPVADLGPQCRLRLLGAAALPGAPRLKRGAEVRDIVPHLIA